MDIDHDEEKIDDTLHDGNAPMDLDPEEKTIRADLHVHGKKVQVRTRVKGDMWHYMRRVNDCIPQGHSLRPVWCSRFRDALFVTNRKDLEEAAAKLRGSGFTDAEIELTYRTNYRWFVTR